MFKLSQRVITQKWFKSLGIAKNLYKTITKKKDEKLFKCPIT